jgi:hypothetical protein
MYDVENVKYGGLDARSIPRDLYGYVKTVQLAGRDNLRMENYIKL